MFWECNASCFLCKCWCQFLLARCFFLLLLFFHTGIPQRLRPSAFDRTTEWMNCNDSLAGIWALSKPTAVPSRSNQELVIKRLWRRALQPPGVGCGLWGGACCTPRQILTHSVCKSLGVEAGLTLPHHISWEIRETEHASVHT